jgi:hypothetical protein
VKHSTVILSATTAPLLIFAGLFAPQAYANQMDALLLPTQDGSHVQFIAFRNIELQYQGTSTLAKDLNGKSERLEFSLQGSDARPVVDAFNAAARERSSPLVLENATVHYVATIKGYSDRAQISYKVNVDAQISNYVLQKEQGKTPAILDLAWRDLSIKGPVTITTHHQGEGGAIAVMTDINQPSGGLDIMVPNLAPKLSAAGADEIMKDPILEFGRFNLPMKSWHYLFDVTGEQLKNYGVFKPGEGATVSIYSIGESSFREGRYVPDEKDATINVDGTQVKVHASTPPPSGQITIAGYSKVEDQNGIEYVTVSSKSVSGLPELGFQMQVLMVFGGMMGAIAVIVLLKTRR